MTKEETEMLKLLEHIKNEQSFREKNDKEIEALELRVKALLTYNGESHTRETEFRTKLVKAAEQYTKGVW